ncbi:hypothetical protein BT96DRAFT_845540 [Gymnopus androsaceus JB14]|uniref:Uncharacterized protein n=1 Tax=Gymnopus androsaceus JB14 TaxID=1447944 RepID=A0A6A4GAC9_9AGAR|nr:hypothetical protein BT96DRAFT_845540 [Gymnopus androsaceus JB14]
MVKSLEWGKDSASQFDIEKYQLVHYARRSTPEADQLLPLTLAGHTITPSDSAKYLGVFIDKKLTFKEHADYAISKGIKASAALTRLSNGTSGMPHGYIRRLFTGLWCESISHHIKCAAANFI